MTLETLSNWKSHGGTQGVYRHASEACGCDMTFAVYLPPQARLGRVPVLWYLSGLTCTHENAMLKSGAQLWAARYDAQLREQASVNPDGLRAQEVIEALEEDIQEELGHAQAFARRIKELWGVVPGSEEFEAEQSFLQPPDRQTDIVHVIKGVIEAEKGAIEHYARIIEHCEGLDWVTQDMVIGIMGDEEGHLRLFEGFLREFEHEGLA